MTTIAWDGKTLAADKRVSFGGAHGVTTKIFRVRGRLFGAAGNESLGAEMREWFERGAIASELPAVQRDEKDCVTVLVVEPDGTYWRYDNGPCPVKMESPFWAIGSGRDFAIAAMHLGKTAAEAVAIASLYEISTGNGIDTLTFEE